MIAPISATRLSNREVIVFFLGRLGMASCLFDPRACRNDGYIRSLVQFMKHRLGE